MTDRDLLAAGLRPARADRVVLPRCRVIIDNDFSGDPDDLFALVHHVLSPSVDIRAIVGSHISVDDEWDRSQAQAENAVRVVHETLAAMGLDGEYRVVQGSNHGLASRDEPRPSEAADAIVAEAMREDSDLPLFVLCGGGLTDIASAYLLEPRIAQRLTLVWIGGPEYEGLASPPPDPGPMEYNLRIDLTAAQVVFDSTIPMWHVPRDVYRQYLMSYAEIVRNVRPHGEIGRLLHDAIVRVMRWTREGGAPGIGETYIMGDQPLVTLTALLSSFHADGSSSAYVRRRAPRITDAGTYEDAPDGREIRVYVRGDARLTFDDLFAKLAWFAGSAA